ncbi:tRNA uridine-5-carboxymethylaminomethyl(34) synthesis GTPase MnmE [Anaerotignum sp. MB30-C6]|uniref:tRNA uridine-5-carboxymethylaminomethyl(34) synthesis GTPase MnmE n=1 Tax=Anaerotignum sp. MB30-C6 TaxID=3070814 RepID=UPI0027DD545F|nr:tRNA uridine-5-carboxymethylaminomethyl(34) synthesis GTPase MnmE [Anaerotignum sp. MB30-C6]WMI81142.1 tRNA uridine-5-carboxymethylaminomethyl(34) synthesis GTPase MnmE [Anaerotignum sp. MB30-C6]
MNRINQLDDIIAAISTPLGMGGIGIVRMSGQGCIALADRLFSGKKSLLEKKSHTLSYGKMVNQGEVIDEVLVSVMKGPQTYTKEDIVEINCHGGSLVTRRVLEAVLNQGARLAEPGEFTKRAFLNGRMDLTQAEAVIDLIHSQTDLSRQAAVNQLEGRLKKEVRSMREEILDMIASIEAVIDYPEHDVEEETYDNMEQGSLKLLNRMETLLANADRGKIIREGLETVIVGKPNVGKSSLLNWLLEEERAIVTDIPGTTRDTVEEYINIDGISMKIVDTAGIRETGDVVERMGVEKSKAYAEKADLILMMLDGSRPLEGEDREILSFIRGKKTMVLINKTDLEQKLTLDELEEYIPKEQIIPVSIKENRGFDELINGLKELFFSGESVKAEDALLGNTRHKNALFQAKEAMERCLVTIRTRMPEDFISMDLQDANRALGEITGDVADEEIIDRIFTKFCLGK